MCKQPEGGLMKTTNILLYLIAALVMTSCGKGKVTANSRGVKIDARNNPQGKGRTTALTAGSCNTADTPVKIGALATKIGEASDIDFPSWQSVTSVSTTTKVWMYVSNVSAASDGTQNVPGIYLASNQGDAIRLVTAALDATFGTADVESMVVASCGSLGSGNCLYLFDADGGTATPTLYVYKEPTEAQVAAVSGSSMTLTLMHSDTLASLYGAAFPYPIGGAARASSTTIGLVTSTGVDVAILNTNAAATSVTFYPTIKTLVYDVDARTLKEVGKLPLDFALLARYKSLFGSFKSLPDATTVSETNFVAQMDAALNYLPQSFQDKVNVIKSGELNKLAENQSTLSSDQIDVASFLSVATASHAALNFGVRSLDVLTETDGVSIVVGTWADDFIFHYSAFTDNPSYADFASETKYTMEYHSLAGLVPQRDSSRTLQTTDGTYYRIYTTEVDGNFSFISKDATGRYTGYDQAPVYASLCH